MTAPGRPRPEAGARAEAQRDAYGRVIDYLRISVTDRCNFRCIYCMPMNLPDLAEGAEILTAEEIETTVRAAVSLGFRKFRLTGGEPTVRKDIVDVVRRVAAIPGVDELAMTTNAVRLVELAEPLREAGLDRVNVHVDSLDPETLPRLMRLGSLERIRAGIDAAEEAGLTPIKLNVVVVRDLNEAEVPALAALTLHRPWHVRFIELMPLGSGAEASLSVRRFVSNEHSREAIEDVLGPLEPVPSANPYDESENFRTAGAAGVIGFISPVSKPYCGTCNRMRLTANGRFHLCLLQDEEIDLRDALRGGLEADERQRAVAAALRRAVEVKPTGHSLAAGLHTKGRRMHQIGG